METGFYRSSSKSFSFSSDHILVLPELIFLMLYLLMEVVSIIEYGLCVLGSDGDKICVPGTDVGLTALATDPGPTHS